MESHRRRRTRDQARKAWYAHHRQVRFARWFGFIREVTDLDDGRLDPRSDTRPVPAGRCPSSDPHPKTPD
jgi:hypothetical protein